MHIMTRSISLKQPEFNKHHSGAKKANRHASGMQPVCRPVYRPVFQSAYSRSETGDFETDRKLMFSLGFEYTPNDLQMV